MITNSRVQKFERYFRDPIIGDDLLQPPMASDASRNIRTALRLLGYAMTPGDRYDQELESKVLAFQVDNDHSALDGFVGPGTRRLLTRRLLEKRGEQPFARMRYPEGKQPPIVFLSYSWRDTETVNKIDQWLRKHGVQVLRDNRDFLPGVAIPDAIREAISQADKVIAIYSSKSKRRDWPSFEINVAEHEESSGRHPLLIYLVLDNTQLPKHDPHRIAIMAKGRTLREVGQDLLRGISGKKGQPPTYTYDENEIL